MHSVSLCSTKLPLREPAAVHNAAYEGWLEGAELLIDLGAKVNASNNAGDTPWHWAQNMGHQDMMSLLEKVRRG